MSAAANASFREETPGRLSARWKTFLFMVGATTAHELCHVFSAYLSQCRGEHAYTPPAINHLNYHVQQNAHQRPSVPAGESGRWVESRLFGGALEYYRDGNDDDGQVSKPGREALMPHLQPHFNNTLDLGWNSARC